MLQQSAYRGTWTIRHFAMLRSVSHGSSCSWQSLVTTRVCWQCSACFVQDRLNILKASVQHAEQQPQRLAETIITTASANEMYWHEDNLRMVLAPILHGEK